MIPKIKTTRSSQTGRTLAQSIGVIDLHFHGAFGIDLMSATGSELNELSHLLWTKGVSGFCPTTLSAPKNELLQAVQSLGQWIRSTRDLSQRSSGSTAGSRRSLPLGIHLEGPFINSLSCGAHPRDSIRPFDFTELEQLWEASQRTLKILTLAPELLSSQQLSQLTRWSRPRGIVLSMGHSQASQEQAENAFQKGFQGVTHAWNACSFHQRSPGILGAALGRSHTYLEMILDQVHVSPSVIRWTLDLHRGQPICFISDCVPAGGWRPSSKKAPWSSFGSLRVQFKEGACRLKNGSLAGGGLLLSDAYCQWVSDEAAWAQLPVKSLLQQTLPYVTQIPLKILGYPVDRLQKRGSRPHVKWIVLDSQEAKSESRLRIAIIPQNP